MLLYCGLGLGLLLIVLVLLKFFPFLFLLLFRYKIAVYLLFVIALVFLQELFVFLFLFFGGVEELAVLALAAKSCLCPELTGLFSLLLVDEGTVFLNTFAPGIISANFASVLSLHLL